MMPDILISINPVHVENILNGSKRYEYRKVSPRSGVDRMIIYSTSPVMKVVAETEIPKVLKGTPEEIWTITKDRSGISREFFDRYYQGKKEAIALEIGKVAVYDVPKTLDEFGIKNPPQSFVYV